MAETTGCQDRTFKAATGNVSLRIYSKTAVRRWAEGENMEELLEDPEFWNTLPDRDDLYMGTTLSVRKDTESFL